MLCHSHNLYPKNSNKHFVSIHTLYDFLTAQVWGHQLHIREPFSKTGRNIQCVFNINNRNQKWCFIHLSTCFGLLSQSFSASSQVNWLGCIIPVFKATQEMTWNIKKIFNCQIWQILVTKKHFHTQTQTVAATFLLPIAGSLWGKEC